MTSHIPPHPLRPAVLVLALAAISCLAAPACAGDPAAVGGGGDPAFVGDYSRQSVGAPVDGGGGNDNAVAFSQATMQREESIGDAEQLLQQVRGQLNGTASSGTRAGDTGNAMRYRTEVEAMVRNHWDQLGPLTRDMYSAQYGRSNPYDTSQTYRSPYGDGGQLENQLLGATRDVQGAMQGAEDLLLPLLQDLKQGFDNSLQQRAMRQR